MKRLPLLTLLLFISFSFYAEETVKKGYNLGVLPAVSYNTDEGLQYGAILNLFNYGDGSKYPAYDHSSYLEISRYTKGSSIYRFYYDSNKLLSGIRSFVDLSYLSEDMIDFYGYNGYKSNYAPSLEENNRSLYKMSQKQLRMIIDLKGSFLTKNLYWIACYNLVKYKNAAVDYSKLNKGIETSDPNYLQTGESLYEKYIGWGLIGSDEAKGGTISSLKAGLVYDTRKVLNNPESGSYSEALIEIAPAFMNSKPYTRYSFVHRQYQSIIKNKLNAAIRLGIQGKIGENSAPFFRRTQLLSPFATRTSVTGLGGVNTLRGILRNRIAGETFALGNFELRWKVHQFKWINQNFYFGLNGFFDTGVIIDPIDWDLTGVSTSEATKFFDLNTKDLFHSSTGGGLKLVMNQNFIISAEFGKAIDERDGGGLCSYINLNYLF